MAHAAQRKFCLKIAQKLPSYFKDVSVLDVGSLHINGNNKHLFINSTYLGIDLMAGRNVDKVCHVCKLNKDKCYDTIISTEALEHDKDYIKSLNYISNHLLCPSGLFLFTCATTGRLPHGIQKRNQQDSPATLDYYKNLTENDIRQAVDLDKIFLDFEFEINERAKDMYFWGIKKAAPNVEKNLVIKRKKT